MTSSLKGIGQAILWQYIRYVIGGRLLVKVEAAVNDSSLKGFRRFCGNTISQECGGYLCCNARELHSSSELKIDSKVRIAAVIGNAELQQRLLYG
ncbi:hypothetical protein J6590_005950 [Homalodisca vitripennis]|nr:hypothetical protein J6590_005950 [Homalodisca vitripennis]